MAMTILLVDVVCRSFTIVQYVVCMHTTEI